MKGNKTMLAKARKASGMTQAAAAAILGVSTPTYIDREEHPSKLTFGQFFELASVMDGDSRKLMDAVLSEVDDCADEWKPLSNLTLGEYYASRNCAARLERELHKRQRTALS